MSLSLLQCYQDDDDESDELNEFIEARTLVPLIGNFSQDRHSQTVNPHIEQSSQLFVSTSQPPTRKREANSLAKVSNGDKCEPNNGLQEFKRVRTFDHVCFHPSCGWAKQLLFSRLWVASCSA